MSMNDGEPAADTAGISIAEHDAAVAAARVQERARIKAIVNAEAAEGRMGQAVVLATETSLSIDEAEKVLAASPRTSRIEALAARASQGAELGSSRDNEPAEPSARAAIGWKQAVASANRRFEKP